MQARQDTPHNIGETGLRGSTTHSAPNFRDTDLTTNRSGRTQSVCRIGILLAPGFSLDEYALFASALESANSLTTMKSFQTQVLSETGGVIFGSLHSGVETDQLDVEDQDFDFFCILSDVDVSFKNVLRLRAYLARLRRQRSIICAIGGSVVALASLHLVEQCALAVHWRSKDILNELSTLHQFSDKLCEADGQFWSACGRTSALDMALSLIAKTGCASTAVLVGQEFVHSRTYNQQSTWDEDVFAMPVTGSATVNKALELFHQNMEPPLPLIDIARRVSVSRRQLERQFSTFCGMTPGKKYKDVRLAQARKYVVRTDLSMVEISVITGFSSAASLVSNYRKKYGTTPRDERSKLRFS